jgi:hypothetical protein
MDWRLWGRVLFALLLCRPDSHTNQTRGNTTPHQQKGNWTRTSSHNHHHHNNKRPEAERTTVTRLQSTPPARPSIALAGCSVPSHPARTCPPPGSELRLTARALCDLTCKVPDRIPTRVNTTSDINRLHQRLIPLHCPSWPLCSHPPPLATSQARQRKTGAFPRPRLDACFSRIKIPPPHLAQFTHSPSVVSLSKSGWSGTQPSGKQVSW